MAGKKYWDVMYTLRPSTSLQMPKIELHRPGIEPGPPTWQASIYHWTNDAVLTYRSTRFAATCTKFFIHWIDQA